MKKIIILISLFFATSAQSQLLYLEDDFVIIARNLLSEMKCYPEDFPLEFTNSLTEAIDTTLILSEYKVFHYGVEKDAVNYTLRRPFKIVLSQSRWAQYSVYGSSVANEIKEKLVIHEYLFTLHIDDSDYQSSTQIYQKINFNRLLGTAICN